MARQSPLPESPVLIAPANGQVIAADTVRFVWRQALPGTSRYWFERASDSLFSTSMVDSTLVDTTTVAHSLPALQTFWWKVRACNAAGWGRFGEVRRFSVKVTGLAQSSGMPVEFGLSQNHPNPFNPGTTIMYQLPGASMVRLSVFDLLGREISVLVNERVEGGTHKISFDGHGLASGTYLCRLHAGDFVSVKRMLFIK